MSWRTVFISKRCKLDLKMGYMVVRGEDTSRVLLDEVSILMIENPAVSLTGCLLEALTEKKIRVIFCDSKHLPMAELVPYFGAYDSSRKIRQQVAWDNEFKGCLWSEIVVEKIKNQAHLLKTLGKERECELLRSYIEQIEHYDSSNREGHAAKVYFNALFGMKFKRADENGINAALNYGYGILLSAFNRAISMSGYLTQIGLFHDNVFNHFNLSSDLMEPFRILVDQVVVQLMPQELTKEIKYNLINILNDYVNINNTKQTIINAIDIYIRSVFDALNNCSMQKICFYSLV